MIKKCKACGKAVDILWPDLWRYKVGKVEQSPMWFCSWGCLRAWEKKRETKRKEVADNVNGSMHRDRREVIMGMISAAEEGKDPDDYLRDIGYKAPAVTIRDIKKWAAKNAPELVDRLEEIRPQKLERKKPEPKKEQPKVELVYDPSIEAEYRREQAQKQANTEAEEAAEKEWTPAAEVYGAAEDAEDDRPPWEEKHPLMDDRELWHTAAIRNDVLGVFYYDKKFNTVDWRHPAGEEISLPPADWNMLARMLNGVLLELGVDNQEWE